jgi:methionine sulfoxide reductase heme-binding subunit
MALLAARTALKLKPVVMAALLLPLAWLVWQWVDYVRTGFTPALTVNPVEYTIRSLGDWGLRFLILGLAITPLVRFTKTPAFTAWRRNIGVIAFSYVAVHLSLYLWLDLELSLAALWADVVKRTYITFGMAAFILLLPLAITSTNGWIKRLGAKKWQRLHRVVYAAVLLGGVHYLFMVKGNQPAPRIYLGIIVLLLLLRLVPKAAKKPVASMA